MRNQTKPIHFIHSTHVAVHFIMGIFSLQILQLVTVAFVKRYKDNYKSRLCINRINCNHVHWNFVIDTCVFVLTFLLVISVLKLLNGPKRRVCEFVIFKMRFVSTHLKQILHSLTVTIPLLQLARLSLEVHPGKRLKPIIKFK